MDSESDSRGNKFYVNEISQTSVTAVCTVNNTSFREKPRNAMNTCSFDGNETWSRFSPNVQNTATWHTWSA